MQVTYRWSGLVVAVFALALPFKAGGCGQTACITVTPSQLKSGACPGLAAAQARFPPCTGPTVEGPGILDDDLCCYPVAHLDNSTACVDNGAGGAAGFGMGGDTSCGGFCGVGGSGGSGGFGGAVGASTCDDALQGQTPFTQVTGSSLSHLMSLEQCGCAGSCLMVCDPTLCVGNAPDNGCLICLLSNCSTQLMACKES
jgi:hypothetical protein